MHSLQLLHGKVWHKRESPKQNEFTYRVFYVSFDVRESTEGKPRLFSFNRFNLMSVFEKDHGTRDGADVLKWVSGIFAESEIAIDELDRIEQIAHPRVFGYAFNPISFFLLLDTDGNIKATLCEVHNTFGDDHSYLLAHEDGGRIAPDDVFTAPKGLFVSPFNDMSGGYTFSIKRTNDFFQADIVYLQDGKSVIRTAVAGHYRPCTSWGIILTYVTHPLMTFMVVVRIHWQAVKVFFKGVPHQMAEKPAEEAGRVTRATLQT